MNDSDLATEHHGGVYLTPEGHKTLQEELENLTMHKRPEIADRIRESQQHGEFSEDNNELDGVKFEQAMVENRIAELKNIFGNAHIINMDEVSTSKVSLGSLVTLEDPEFGDCFDVRAVTSIEADPNKDLVSNESPLGVAMMGKKKGDEIVVDAPDGQKTYKIKKISK